MEKLRRTLLLGMLLAFPATYQLKPITDNDVFFHMRVGGWILEHRAVTATDPFTVFGQGKPYVAYAWLFQVLLDVSHRAAGFVGVALLAAALSFVAAFAIQRLVAHRGAGFTQGALVTALALTGLLRLMGPRSWLFTIIFFAVVLDAILRAREQGTTRPLVPLPAIFALWANTHIQFVYGLALLGLLGIESLVERIHPPRDRLEPLDPRRILIIGVACTLATLANPYHVGVWQTVLEYATAKGAYAVVSEHMPLTFQQLPDWCFVAITVGAFVALLHRRERRTFPWLALAFATLLGIRSGRDMFAPVIVAAPLIATALPRGTEEDRFPARPVQWAPVLLISALFLALVAGARDLDERKMRQKIAKEFPAEAAAAVLEKDLPGPVFNDYDWGSYLIWALPGRLVAIDGRTNLHGDARIERSKATWSGQYDWQHDEDLERARSIVANREKPLTALLKTDPRFTLVHEDDVACVFSRNEARR